VAQVFTGWAVCVHITSVLS